MQSAILQCSKPLNAPCAQDILSCTTVLQTVRKHTGSQTKTDLAMLVVPDVLAGIT